MQKDHKYPKCNGTGLEQLSDEIGDIGVGVKCDWCEGSGLIDGINFFSPYKFVINGRLMPIISMA